MSRPQSVACSEHGERSATFVCQHLPAGRKLGFHCSDESPEALWPDAWCAACEAIATEEGGWTKRAVKRAGLDITLICDGCYDNARRRNWREPRGRFQRLLTRARTAFEPRQQRFIDTYRVDDFPRWDWNQGTGQLVFSGARKRRVIADFVFAGSLSTRASTWMWSWANASDDEAVKAPLRAVRDYGEQQRLLRLSAALWRADEHDGWQMTAIAAYLLDAQAVYRTPSDFGFSYLVLTRIRAEP